MGEVDFPPGTSHYLPFPAMQEIRKSYLNVA
jgi:hypothetical protein